MIDIMLQYHIIQYYMLSIVPSYMIVCGYIKKNTYTFPYCILHPTETAMSVRGLLMVEDYYKMWCQKGSNYYIYYIFPNLMLVIFIQKNQIFFINKGDRLKTSTCIKYDSWGVLPSLVLLHFKVVRVSHTS